MNQETSTASPVKYMVVSALIQPYKVIDTSFEEQGTTVCFVKNLRIAHQIARVMNRAEGYEYPDEV